MTKAERAAKRREGSWSRCTAIVEVRRRGDLSGNGGTEWATVFGYDGQLATETCIEFGKSLLVAMLRVKAKAQAQRTTVRVTNTESGAS